VQDLDLSQCQEWVGRGWERVRNVGEDKHRNGEGGKDTHRDELMMEKSRGRRVFIGKKTCWVGSFLLCCCDFSWWSAVGKVQKLGRHAIVGLECVVSTEFGGKMLQMNTYECLKFEDTIDHANHIDYIS
jgi:hypothetical protein